MCLTKFSKTIHSRSFTARQEPLTRQREDDEGYLYRVAL